MYELKQKYWKGSYE